MTAPTFLPEHLHRTPQGHGRGWTEGGAMNEELRRTVAERMQSAVFDRYRDCPECVRDIQAALPWPAWETMAEAAEKEIHIARIRGQVAASGHPSGRHG